MNLIGNKYEWTIILGYYFVWQFLSFLIQACVMWQLAGQWSFLFQLVMSWGPHILVQCFAINTMFLLTILKEDTENGFLRPVDTSYHSHTRSWLWNLKLYILNAFFHIFSVRILCIHFILQHALQTKLVWVHLWQMKRPQSCLLLGLPHK
jgi:hypothetical protein